MLKVTANFYLDRRGKKKKTVYCYIREGKNTMMLNTGLRIEEKHWSKRNQRAIVSGKGKMIGATEFNLLLDNIENQINRKIYNVLTNDFQADFTTVRNELEKAFNKKTEDFWEVYDKFLEAKKPLFSNDYQKKYNNIRNHLLEFEKEKNNKLTFSSINLSFYELFISYLIQTKKLTNNTAYKQISFIKSFMSWATDRGFNSNTEFKKFKVKEDQTEVIFLTEEELMKLYDTELKDERLEKVKDVFLFQCFTGARYSDIKNLRRDSIKEDYWQLRTQKTRDLLNIPLSSYAKNILNKYSEDPNPLPTISIQKFNNYLKDVGEKVGITDPVTRIQYRGSESSEETKPKYQFMSSHMARRTFVSLSIKKGMKPDVIMSITGHSTYRMMQKYLKIDEPTKREEMQNTWG